MIKITEDLYCLKMPFTIQLNAGMRLERFVNIYFAPGSNPGMIDAGTAGALEFVRDCCRNIGHDVNTVECIWLTHAHPDHIGGAAAFKRELGCKVAAHKLDIPWIEDVELQVTERPVPGFSGLVEGSVKVDRQLNDGDTFRCGDSCWQALHTPGHASGHLAFYRAEDRILIAGDCIPQPGAMPIYDDVAVSLASLERLKKLDIDILLSAWDEEIYSGSAVQTRLKAGTEWLNAVSDAVRQACENVGSHELSSVAGETVKLLGLPLSTMNPVFFRTIKAYLNNIKDN
jgi:glyoxylase-like metal-dependent hydrolase (beta-lactamase superfamily II)